jgi:membrane dipeptidase
VIGVEGFDVLVRSAADLARLRGLFERGVRLFQPVYAPSNVLAGCSASGDDRGLTDLGRASLASLFDLGAEAEGPRPMFDLAHLNPRSAGEALDWFEADAVRSRRVIPVYSHGALNHAGFATPRAITLDNLRRLRALGGVIGLSVGPPFHDSTESLKTGIETAASLPFEGRPGFEGIAIGTDFLGVDQTLAGLGNVEGVTAWVKSAFDPAAADAIVQANGRKLILRCAGVSEAEP